MKKLNVCLVLIFLALFLSGCSINNENIVTFEVEKIYITNELSHFEYPVISLKIAVYDEKNEYVLLQKVFDYDSNGLAEFSIKSPVDINNELENGDYLIPNYSNILSVKNNEIVRFNIYMVFVCDNQQVIWDLSSFLRVNGNSENIVLENQAWDSENHFRYHLSKRGEVIDYCNIQLVTKIPS